MVVVQQIFDKYGPGPDQLMFMEKGNEWLKTAAPALSYIKTATIAPDEKK